MARSTSTKWFALALAFALCGTMLGAAAVPEPSTEPIPSITPEPPLEFEVHGKVVGKDGLPAEGVIVLAYHLATEELFTATTGSSAEFSLTHLPIGYYDFAARSADGFYVGNQVASVNPIDARRLELRLKDFDEDQESSVSRAYFPGSEDTPTGVAQISGPLGGGQSFWTTKTSRFVLGGGGALTLLALGGGSASTPPASPFTP